MKKSFDDLLKNNYIKMILENKISNNLDFLILNIIEDLNDINKSLINFGINLSIKDLLIYYLILYKNDFEKYKKLNNISNINIKNYYNLNNNNYQENIGDFVEVKINDKKYIGIFLGSLPDFDDLEIKYMKNEIIINSNSQNGIIFVPKLNKLFSTKEIWFKKLRKEINNKLKTEITNLIDSFEKDLNENN